MFVIHISTYIWTYFLNKFVLQLLENEENLSDIGTSLRKSGGNVHGCVIKLLCEFFIYAKYLKAREALGEFFRRILRLWAEQQLAGEGECCRKQAKCSAFEGLH